APQVGRLLALDAADIDAPPRRSLFRGGVKGPFDLHDVVLIETVNLDNGPRRIGRLAPQFLLHLVYDRPESEHVSHIDDDTHAIAQARAFRFGYQLHVEERLPNSRLVALDQIVCLRIDATHAGDVDEIARARAD